MMIDGIFDQKDILMFCTIMMISGEFSHFEIHSPHSQTLSAQATKFCITAVRKALAAPVRRWLAAVVVGHGRLSC